MNKLYLLVSAMMLITCSSISAQSTKKSEKTQTATNTTTESATIYVIDGIRAQSPMDFFKIKSEDIYSMNIVNDPTEINKKYARKGENLKSVIVVETVKRQSQPETVTSDKINSTKSRN